MPSWALFASSLMSFTYRLGLVLTFNLSILLFQLILSYLIICIIWRIKPKKEDELEKNLEAQNKNITSWGIKLVSIISIIFVLLILAWSCFYSWEVFVKEMFGEEALTNQKKYQDTLDKYFVNDFLSFTEYKIETISNSAGRASNEPFTFHKADSISVSASPTASYAYYQKLFSDKNKWITKKEETDNYTIYKFYKTINIDSEEYNSIKWESDGSVSLGWLNNYAKAGDSFGIIKIDKTEKLIDIKVFIVDNEGLELVQNYINRHGAKLNDLYTINDITDSSYLKISEKNKWETCFQIENDLQRQGCYSKVIIATNPDTRIYSHDNLGCDLIKDEKIKEECHKIYERTNAEEKAFDPHRYESTDFSACNSLNPADRAICYSFAANGEGSCSDCDVLDSQKIIEINYLGNQMTKTEKEICEIYCEAKERMRSVWSSN